MADIKMKSLVNSRPLSDMPRRYGIRVFNPITREDCRDTDYDVIDNTILDYLHTRPHRCHHHDRREIPVSRYKFLEMTIEYVFRANFNDSYYLETVYVDLSDLDKEMNDTALEVERTGEGKPDSLMSVYRKDGSEYWIITEWNRSVTTILLPCEY